MRQDEYQAVAEMTVSAYTEALGGWIDDEYREELADVAGRTGEADVLVAVGAGGELMGSVTYVRGPGRYREFEPPDEAGIRILVVGVAAQRRGIGGALVRACIDRARAEGRSRVVLFTAPVMTAAQRLYESMGFRRVPERDWAYDDDLTLMGYAFDV